MSSGSDFSVVSDGNILFLFKHNNTAFRREGHIYFLKLHFLLNFKGGTLHI